MVGKLNRLYRLRSRYDIAVSKSENPRISAAVLGTGVKLARCQRQFNLELATRRRTAAHTGTPVGVPTQVPKTSADFLSLILVEQRRIAGALEQVVKHMALQVCALFLGSLFLSYIVADFQSSRVAWVAKMMAMIVLVTILMMRAVPATVSRRLAAQLARVMRMPLLEGVRAVMVVVVVMVSDFIVFCFFWFLYA